MQGRRIPLPLNVPADLYQRIERLADSQERTAIQQSIWLLKQALDGLGDGAEVVAERGLVAASGATDPAVNR